MTSAVQGVEGGKSVTLAGLHYSFLKEQMEQERLEIPVVASKLALSFQGVVNCKKVHPRMCRKCHLDKDGIRNLHN